VVVADASIALPWAIPDQQDRASRRLWTAFRRSRLIVRVPVIFPIEVRNTLVRLESKGGLPQTAVVQFLRLLESLPLVVDALPDTAGLDRVDDLRRLHGLTAYDGLYLDLAIRLGAPLATNDRELRAAAPHEGVPLV
jgi:predicted nucleic acid-binding protein